MVSHAWVYGYGMLWKGGDDSSSGVRLALEHTFVSLDAEVLKECKTKRQWIGSGSCGLVAIVHPIHGLHVACAGDSRAVLAVEHNGYPIAPYLLVMTQ
jgi:serine/threonine protein phosphatase PrpC